MHFKQIYSIPHYYTSKLSGWQIKKWGFVKVTTGFSYNRRYHSFSYSSSRLDPHSDYWRFLIGREKPLCGFGCALQDKKGLRLRASTGAIPFQSCSLLFPSLRKSSLTARGQSLYGIRTASVYQKTTVPYLQNPEVFWQNGSIAQRTFLAADRIRPRAVTEDMTQTLS